MYPSIHPGDLLTIRHASLIEAAIGDIAICRNSNYIFAHRIVEKGIAENRQYIVTKADRNVGGRDQPTYEEGFIGVVVAITDSLGKPRPLHPQKHPLPQQWYHQLLAKLIDYKNSAAHFTVQLGSPFLPSLLCRTFVNMWLGVASHRFEVRVPLNKTLGDGLYATYNPEFFTLQSSFKGQNLRRWLLTLHLNGASIPDGYVIAVRNELSDNWHLHVPVVRRRYQVTMLAQMLIDKANTLLPKQV
jgi:hypothetical protein